MSNTYVMLMIAVIAVVTMLLRFLPFLIFGERQTPKYIEYLGRFLPYAIMGMLVVYCLKGMTFVKAPYGIPEIIAVAVTAGLHVWKRNTLVSIICGTVCYMLLIQFLF